MHLAFLIDYKWLFLKMSQRSRLFWLTEVGTWHYKLRIFFVFLATVSLRLTVLTTDWLHANMQSVALYGFKSCRPFNIYGRSLKAKARGWSNIQLATYVAGFSVSHLTFHMQPSHSHTPHQKTRKAWCEGHTRDIHGWIFRMPWRMTLQILRRGRAGFRRIFRSWSEGRRCCDIHFPS